MYIGATVVVLWILIWLYRDSLEIENITDKYVLVTGCDSGFGNLLCKKLDRKGFRVVAGCLTEKGADDLKRVAGPYLKTVILDVTNQDSIQKAMEFTKKEVGEKGKRSFALFKCKMTLLIKGVSLIQNVLFPRLSSTSFLPCRALGYCEQCWALITHGPYRVDESGGFPQYTESQHEWSDRHDNDFPAPHQKGSWPHCKRSIGAW